MDINTRYKHGELSADVAKAKKEKLAIDPNSKVTQVQLLETAMISQVLNQKLIHQSLEWLKKETTSHAYR
jgi:hypothetical protein